MFIELCIYNIAENPENKKIKKLKINNMDINRTYAVVKITT